MGFNSAGARRAMDVRMLSLNVEGDERMEEDRADDPLLGPWAEPPLPLAGVRLPRPDQAGSRRVAPGGSSVFVVDGDGYRHLIPNHLTYNRLFRSWQGIVDDPDLERMAERPALTSGAMLIRGDLSTALYLLDHGIKRCIPSPAVVDKYGFSWERIEVLKQFLVDTIPNGRPWK